MSNWSSDSEIEFKLQNYRHMSNPSVIHRFGDTLVVLTQHKRKSMLWVVTKNEYREPAWAEGTSANTKTLQTLLPLYISFAQELDSFLQQKGTRIGSHTADMIEKYFVEYNRLMIIKLRRARFRNRKIKRRLRRHIATLQAFDAERQGMPAGTHPALVQHAQSLAKEISRRQALQDVLEQHPELNIEESLQLVEEQYPAYPTPVATLSQPPASPYQAPSATPLYFVD